MALNFPTFVKDIKLQVQKALQNLNSINMKENHTALRSLIQTTQKNLDKVQKNDKPNIKELQ